MKDQNKIVAKSTLTSQQRVNEAFKLEKIKEYDDLHFEFHQININTSQFDALLKLSNAQLDIQIGNLSRDIKLSQELKG